MRSAFTSSTRRGTYQGAGDASISGAVGGQLETTDIATSPTALYVFDGTLEDSSGAGNDLAVSTGTEKYLYFNGVRYAFFDGATRLQVTAAAHRLQADCTVFMEILMLNEQTNLHYLAGCGSDSVGSGDFNHQWFTYVNNSQLYWTHQNGTKTANTTIMSDYRNGIIGASHTIAFVRDATAKTVKYYWDAALINETDTYTNNADGGAQAVTQFGGGTGGANFLDLAGMRNFGLYAAALSAADILTLTKKCQGVT